MAFTPSLSKSLIVVFSCLLSFQTSHALEVPLHLTAPTTGNVVHGNFLGISLEFSFLGEYFGTDVDTTPQPFLNYLANYNELLPEIPFRLRIGGNSIDSSVFNASQTQFSIPITSGSNADDQPVTYGPLVFKVMDAVARRLGGVEYLFGLSLLDPADPTLPEIAETAQSTLGDKIDGYVLGNEPDLYSSHGKRPNLANYTVNDYISDYNEVFDQLRQSPIGNASLNKIVGPSICCSWDLATLLQQGWLDDFKQQLKYISLQHYPKNNCGLPGSTHPTLGYYVNHTNVVALAKWNIHGVNIANQAGKPVIMTEFSSVSCGGYPNVSDTFGATLWSVDYAMQMSVVGYSAVHLHTRERNISYNLFDYPGGGVDGWTTKPVYYSYFPVLQGLQNPSGSRVVDLGLNSSSTAGYGIYDQETSELYRLILINFKDGNGPVNFTIPAISSPRAGGGKNATVKFLTAPSLHEGSDISWSGMTWKGVQDGNPVPSGRDQDLAQVDVSASYTLQIPSPGLAVVMFENPLQCGEPDLGEPSNNLSARSPDPGNTYAKGRKQPRQWR